MIEYGVAISLTIIAILALITDILAIVVIAHYFPFFHGTDVTLTSLMCAMVGNAILVLPMPAFLELLDMPWTPNLCTGYVWAFLTFRLSQMLSLAILTIHWSTLLKLSADKKGHFSTKLLKISVVFVWLSSIIFGCLPLIGVADNSYNEHQTCKFLSFNVGPGFALFFIIANIACMLVSVICATDATFLIKHMKRIAKTKYNTGRFHIPDSRADIPGQVTNYVTERYHRLNFAWDLSRFVLVFVLLAFLLNHLPYTIIQGLQLFTQLDRSTLEVISLYLVGFEALIIPHSLWLISKRYRHGLSYLWRVHVLRKHEEKEEDKCSCLQQSYTQREKDRVSVAPSRPPSSQGRPGGYSVSASGTLRSTKSDVMGRELLQPNGRTQIATIPSPQTHKHVVQLNGAVRGEVRVEPHNHSYDERAIDTIGLEVHRSRTPVQSEGGTPRSGFDHPVRTPDRNNMDSLAVSRLDVKRSSSGASRREWKEHMRLKHLPPIFVNDGFETADRKLATIKPEEVAVKHTPIAEGGNALHYYMSSDYHPDYLTDSLPRHKLAQALSLDSEEDGSNNRGRLAYEDTDIDEVLTSSSPTDDHYWIKRRELFTSSGKNTSGDERPAMSTFKAPVNEYRVSSVDKRDHVDHMSGKGVYGTFEDLSVTNIPAESEIMFNIGSIPADHIREGYNSLRRIKRKEGDIIGTDLQNGLNHSFSGRTCESSTPTNSPDFRSLGRTKKRFITNPVYPIQNSGPNPTQNVDRFYYSFSNSTNSDTNNQNKSENANKSKDIPDNNTVFQTDTSRQVYSGTGLFRADSRRLSDRFSLEEEESPSNSQPNSSNTSNTESQMPSSSIEDDNESTGSNSSVTISPYRDGTRHKPWLDDVDRHHGDRYMLQMTEPLCGGESDTDTLKDSHDSIELRISDGKLTHSNRSTPVSSLFDEETDRGFEEALEQHATLAPGASVYGGVGLCFESIKEEPEDLTSSGSNPFLDNLSNGEDEFRTRAVVSRGSNYDSRPSSVTSVDRDDNSCSRNTGVAPPTSGSDYKYSNKVSNYLFHDTEYDFEHGDSGFTSGLEKGNWSDSSGYQDTITPRADNISPWPDHPDVVANTDNAFESNFCSRVRDDGVHTDSNRRGPSLKRSQFVQYKVSSVDLSDATSHRRAPDKNVQLSKSGGTRLPHRGVHRLTSTSGQSIVRVRSMDDQSPIASRKQPKRVNSFEIQPDVRPAYF